MLNPWPQIDPRIEYIGVSKLHGFNVKTIGQLEGPVVIQENGKPLAVLVGYVEYIALQQLAGDKREE